MSRVAQRMEMGKTLEGLPPASDRKGRVRYVWNRIVAEATLVNASQETASEEFFTTGTPTTKSPLIPGGSKSSLPCFDSEPMMVARNDDATTQSQRGPNQGKVGRRASVAIMRLMSYCILSSSCLLDCVAKRIAAFVAPKHPSSSSSSSINQRRGSSGGGTFVPSDTTLGDLDHDELIDYFRYYNDWRMNPEVDSNEMKPLQGESDAYAECFHKQRARFRSSLAMTIEEHIAEDVIASYDRDPASLRFLEPVLYAKGFHALQLHRLAERLWHSQEIDFSLMLQSASSRVFGVDIHPAAHFGFGVMMDHASGVVVGETAVVGNYVSMLHSVTLGGTGKHGRDRHPKLDDGVMIGASSSILGNIRIGERAKIAAGATVVKDVAPRATVIGVAAKELSRSMPDEADRATMMQEVVPQSPQCLIGVAQKAAAAGNNNNNNNNESSRSFEQANAEDQQQQQHSQSVLTASSNWASSSHISTQAGSLSSSAHPSFNKSSSNNKLVRAKPEEGEDGSNSSGLSPSSSPPPPRSDSIDTAPPSPAANIGSGSTNNNSTNNNNNNNNNNNSSDDASSDAQTRGWNAETVDVSLSAELFVPMI